MVSGIRSSATGAYMRDKVRCCKTSTTIDFLIDNRGKYSGGTQHRRLEFIAYSAAKIPLDSLCSQFYELIVAGAGKSFADPAAVLNEVFANEDRTDTLGDVCRQHVPGGCLSLSVLIFDNLTLSEKGTNVTICM